MKILKANKILLVENVDQKNFKRIENKVNNRNVAMFYQLSSIFKFDELEKFSMSYIERCFPIVCEKNNFKNLSFAVIEKIISSSELDIDSEIELTNAMYSWISYDFEERSKFARRLLSKVRLNLLSVNVLKRVLTNDVSFSKIDECVALVTDVLKINTNSVHNKVSRYCSQNMYSFWVIGGYEDQPTCKRFSNVTKQIDAKNFNNVRDIDSIKIKRMDQKSVYCRGAVYVFGGWDGNKKVVRSVEKYSLATNKWEIVSKMFDDRAGFNACRFMDQIFIIGGGYLYNNMKTFYSCRKFDTRVNKWNELAKINKAIIGAASTVYEGKIVVSGGYNNLDARTYVKTVLAYDPFADTWSSMPSMIHGRCLHSSVAVRNKLFVFKSFRRQGIESCEVFDSSCKKFVLLKRFPSTLTFNLRSIVANTFSIGNKLITIRIKNFT